MNWIITIYSALLFFVLSPGVLLRLPAKSGKFVVAATHAVVFALVWHFTSKIVWRMSSGREGFAEGLSDVQKTKFQSGAPNGASCSTAYGTSPYKNNNGKWYSCVGAGPASDKLGKWTETAAPQ
jgi:hypothetical protein